MPWFVIYPLGSSFSYENDASKYKVRSGSFRTSLISSQRAATSWWVWVPAARAASARQPSPNSKRRDQWLQINGEASMGLVPDRHRVGRRQRCSLHLQQGRPRPLLLRYGVAGQTLRITSVDPRPIQSVEMLGFPGTLKFSREATDNFFRFRSLTNYKTHHIGAASSPGIQAELRHINEPSGGRRLRLQAMRFFFAPSGQGMTEPFVVSRLSQLTNCLKTIKVNGDFTVCRAGHACISQEQHGAISFMAARLKDIADDLGISVVTVRRSCESPGHRGRDSEASPEANAGTELPAELGGALAGLRAGHGRWDSLFRICCIPFFADMPRQYRWRPEARIQPSHLFVR